MEETIVQQEIGNAVALGISSAIKNQDGSLTVTFGYISKNMNTLKLSDASDCIEIKKGTAILLKGIPRTLSHGYHMNDYQMVFIGDTEVQWNIFGHTLIWNTKELSKAFIDG